MAQISQDFAFSVPQGPAPPPFHPDVEQWASEHFADSAAGRGRCPVALVLEPHEIPLARTAPNQASTPSYLSPNSTQVLPLRSSGGNGYGPPEPPTPLFNRICSTLLGEAGNDYDAVALPLTNVEWKRRWDRLCVSSGSVTSPQDTGEPGVTISAEQWRIGGHFRRNEVNITRQAEALKSVCIAAQWLELDSELEGIRFDTEIALKQEVQYASYLHVTTLLLPPPRNPDYVTDYARAVRAALAMSTSVQLSVQIPVSDLGGSVKRPGLADRMATWEDWDAIRRLCGYHSRLTVTLDMTYFVHSPQLLQRWVAEPVACLFIPASCFISNAKQFPVLTRHEQNFLKGILKYGPTIILGQTGKGLHKSGGPAAYVQYIRFIERKIAPPDPIERFAGTIYLDHLQAPLQPLADHLESQTYSGFEIDPEKYSAYDRAVCAALLDRPSTRTYMIFVCGAGRGPLVAACLRAANRAGRQVRITAVEKNPNVWATLQERQATEWGRAVELIFADCRTFTPTEKADILVTELLGSFGDNELSPECIDGAIRWLKDDGISIPHSYASYVAPLSSSKLHSRVLDASKSEMPYVVMIHKASTISDISPSGNFKKIGFVWDFVHSVTSDTVRDASGLPITNCHNARSAHLTFYIPIATVCHGFGGYFTAQLYGNITLDIRPDQEMSRKMLSWFPIFFPFKEPLYLPCRCQLDIHIWRQTDSAARKVWYEWSADVFLPTSELARPPLATEPMSDRNPTSDSGEVKSPIIPVPTTPMLDSLLPGSPPPDFQTYGDPSKSRLRIASTSLHNAGGTVSSISL